MTKNKKRNWATQQGKNRKNEKRNEESGGKQENTRKQSTTAK